MISVIIPVYNVQEYLDKCIESVVNQTYSSLEIILVDDGSTDTSGRICDRWSERDQRIKVIHQKNGGLSAARNVGVRMSTGDYVCFLDADDYVDTAMYGCMLSLLEKTGAQVAVCKEISFHDSADDRENVFVSDYEVLDKQAVLDKFTADFQGHITWAWNKLYKRELMEGLSYWEGTTMEDIFYAVDIAQRVERVVWTENCFYHYRMRAGSIMHSGRTEVLLHHAIALRYELEKLGDLSTEEYKCLLQVQNLKKIGSLCAEAWRKKDREIYRQIRGIYKEIYGQCRKDMIGFRNYLILFLNRYFCVVVAGLSDLRKEDKR